jgi:hypothetical protein
MAHLISFRTARFDVSKETPNPINPIAGEGVLNWLRDELAKAQYRSTAPSTEDWGWYIDVEGPGASYFVGASGDAEDSTPEREWIVQVHKKRSLRDKLLGRNKMTSDDALFALIESIVRADNRIEQVAVDKDAQ